MGWDKVADFFKIRKNPKNSSNEALGEYEKNKLSFAFRNLDEMDPKLLPTQPGTIHVLDLTENNFTGAVDLRFLFEFTNLHTLILDKNQIQSNFTIPPMEQLTTLWVNHNRIENLAVFIENLQKHCPNLVYLSMMNNKAAPSYFNGGSLVEYNDYKMYVISKLTKLQMIDHKEITAEERLQSQAIYGQGRLARYNDFSVEDQLRRRRSTLKQRKFSSSTLEKTETSKSRRNSRQKNVKRKAQIVKNEQEIVGEVKEELIDLDGENEDTFEMMIEAILDNNKLRPPTPSLSMLNKLERKELAPDHAALFVPIPPPPPPASLFG